MKKAITIFCIIVLSVQLLPIKQLGKCFAENQWVEEEGCKQSTGKELDLTKYLGAELTTLCAPVLIVKNWAYVLNDGLVQAPVRTILAPPPNRIV